ncbi:MAG: DegT/DnrJ/EryC1/StrS family aminotransferase [Methanobacteriota archaeon]|nr:MAG: DegT/DnrJ/EryC1/StrS family aminotransferase [Euryarchaeota archaeon]
MIPIVKPSIDEGDIARAVHVLRSGNLVQGKYVQELENCIADYIGVPYAVAVSSGTAGLHLCLVCLGVGVGDEVIVPAFSFVATANVVELVGATPVFVDIDPNTCNIDAGLIEEKINNRTKAIIVVHEFGRPADMNTIMRIAEREKIPVIEDAACALGSEWEGRKVGAIATAGMFSFHPRKVVTSGEGGVVVTNNSELACRMKSLRNHGLTSTKEGVKLSCAGFNYRLTDFQAAMLLGQIERLEEALELRSEIASYYGEELSDLPIKTPPMGDKDKIAWQSYHVILRKEEEQNKFFSYLKRNGIESNIGAQCIPMQDFYRNKYGYCPGDYAGAETAYKRGAVLPIYEKLAKEDLEKVVTVVRSFYRRGIQ